MGNNRMERIGSVRREQDFYSQGGREYGCGRARDSGMWKRRRSKGITSVLKGHHQPPQNKAAFTSQTQIARYYIVKARVKAYLSWIEEHFSTRGMYRKGIKTKCPSAARHPNKFWQEVHPKRAGAKLWLWMHCRFSKVGFI
jgi:hypothetical protein